MVLPLSMAVPGLEPRTPLPLLHVGALLPLETLLSWMSEQRGDASTASRTVIPKEGGRVLGETLIQRGTFSNLVLGRWGLEPGLCLTERKNPVILTTKGNRPHD